MFAYSLFDDFFLLQNASYCSFLRPCGEALLYQISFCTIPLRCNFARYICYKFAALPFVAENDAAWKQRMKNSRTKQLIFQLFFLVSLALRFVSNSKLSSDCCLRLYHSYSLRPQLKRLRIVAVSACAHIIPTSFFSSYW